jgi:MFS family permease
VNARAIGHEAKVRVVTGANETFRSMRIRNFRLFFTGQLVSQVGNWLTRVGLTLLVLKLTDDGVAVGLVAACEFLPMLLLGAWAGVVADRSDKRRLLIIVQSLAMLQSFALASLAFMDHPPLWGLYAVALAGGFTTAFDFPARRAFVLQMVPIGEIPNAVSLNTAIMNLARVVGPALAGLLVVTVGYGWCFTIDAFSYVAVLAGLFMIDPSQLREIPLAAKAKGQVREGLRYARSKADLWIPLVVMGIVGVLAYNFQVVLPLLVTKTFHGSEGTFTVLYSVFSVGSLTGALTAARRKGVSLATVVGTCLTFGITMLAYAAAPTLAWSFAGIFVVGWASTYFMTAASTIVQTNADQSMQGRIGALQSIVLMGSTPIGGPILGWVCDRYGARYGVLIGAIAGLAAAGWGATMRRRQIGELAEPSLLRADGARADGARADGARTGEHVAVA